VAWRVAVLGVALVAAATAAVFALGRGPAMEPLVRLLHSRLPGLERHTHLDTSIAEFGSTFTIDGTTPHHLDGAVHVEGRWNGGAWKPLSNGATRRGAYTLRFPIRKHGTLELRVSYPGGDADGTVIVP
jgi:hypothetical protein